MPKQFCESGQTVFAISRVVERSRLLQRACSCDQASLSRPTVAADSPPASLPSSAISASSKSPVEMLCVPRTSSGVPKVKPGNIGGEGRREWAER